MSARSTPGAITQMSTKGLRVAWAGVSAIVVESALLALGLSDTMVMAFACVGKADP